MPDTNYSHETGARPVQAQFVNRSSPPAQENPQHDTRPDLRFRNLIGENAWARLPERVQRRFSKCITPESPVRYSGRVVETQLNGLGWILAQCLRVIGAPLPLGGKGSCGFADVEVSTNRKMGDQIWTRSYKTGPDQWQTIVSRKCFAGPTGLEERVTRSIGMTLIVREQDGALNFRSQGYFIELFATRIVLPRWLSPGAMTITHRDLGSGRFQFELNLQHAWFGRLVYQNAEFYDQL